MKKLKIKNIAIASAFIAGNLIVLTSNATTTLYSGIPGTLDGNNGNSLISSVTLAAAQTISYSITGALTSQQPSALIRFELQNGGTSVGGFTRSFTSSTATLNGTFSATGAADSLYFISSSGGIFSISNLTLTYTPSSSSSSSSSSLAVELAPNAYALRSVYNIQSAALHAGLSYDCNMFDKQGFCLSTGGRYSTTNSPETNTTSGLLIGSYKYDKHIRLGAWVDQNLSTNNTTGMTLSNSNPLFGVFGAWAGRNDGLGYEVKVSAGYGDKDVTVTRTSANQGTSQLRMRGISTVSSFGFAIDGGLIAAPYVGVKYTSINRAAYTEGGSSALTYDNLRQESTTAVAGVRLSGKIDNQTGFVVSAGAEHDLNHNVGQYSAGSSNTTAFNSNVQKTRPVVTAGVFYDIDKTQRIGVNAIHRQEPFQSTTSTTGLVTYTVGF